MVIVKAEYGNLPDGPLADVTRQVAALVKAGALSVDASNDNFGDPAQGKSKKLRVDYRVGRRDGQQDGRRGGGPDVHGDLDASGDRRCDLRSDGRSPG